jgi:ferric-dicitrate binding protein FerR (iron transport regulator)
MNNNSPLGNDDEIPFEFQPLFVPKEIQTNNWKAVEVSINEDLPFLQNSSKKNILWFFSVIVLVGAGLLLYKFVYTANTNLYKTQYAQVKNITLPDGSKVTLNANSQLKLSSNWSEQGDRQVWLEGEAYFEVEKKLATGQKFIVHTKDMDVEVLGTKFNVNTRHQKAIVSLEEGKIKLSVNGQIKEILKKNYKEEIIEMKPGELVTVDSAKGIDIANVQNIDFHSGWVRNEYHFSNTSLKEIATLIKDIHGYTVLSDDENMLQHTITGDLRAANLQELIDVLEIAFKLKIEVENKTIRIIKPS